MAKRRKAKIRYNRVVILLLPILTIILSVIVIVKDYNKNSEFDKKAVWISYLNMSSLKDKEESEFIQQFTMMCEQAKNKRLDTLIVHVRAFNDAIYPSELYPLSTSISSNTQMDYDAFSLMVDIAHEHQLKIEAWINPYRISYNEKQLQYFIENASVSDWIHTKHILRNGSTAILNPASEEVRNYIVSGVKEIIDRYNVDGIHMDDYFYVESLFGNTTMEERCTNVNLLVKQIYQTIKEKDNTITFGISPQGNLENARNIGADIDTWLSESGYVDYVMPQIYWTDNWGADGSVTMFSSRVEEYKAIHTNHEAKLYAGLALYLAGQEVLDDAGWSIYQDNLKRQSDILKEHQYAGYALFDYDSLLVESTQEELNNLIK